MNLYPDHVQALISMVDLLTKRVVSLEKLVEKAMVLKTIADAYDSNDLDNDARKRWGMNDEHPSSTLPEHIELYAGRGGRRLLTLTHCLEFRASFVELLNHAPKTK